MNDLDVLRSVDFDWTRQLRSIWRDPRYHVPLIHQEVADDVMAYFKSRTNCTPDNEPNGCIVVGPAGLGKTHLMGELRRRVWDNDGYFILLDLVGIREFWQSVALGFLNSLQVRVNETSTQYDRLILKTATYLALADRLQETAVRLRGKPRDLVIELANLFVSALAQRDRALTLQHRDVVRALVFLISEDIDCASIAHGWLQGMDLDVGELRQLGFISVKKSPIEIVRGVSWIMSLAGPTMIAVDQIDAIVSESNIRARNTTGDGGEEEAEARLIIESLASGLMDLHEVKRRAITVVTCLEATWTILEQQSTVAVTARYQQAKLLRPLDKSTIAYAMIAARLKHAYDAVEFVPPYETWPIRPEAFDSAIGFTPRQLLRACDEHRNACVAAGAVFELRSFANVRNVGDAPPPSGLDEIFGRELSSASVEGLLDQEHENRLQDILYNALDCYGRSLALPDEIDISVQSDANQKRPSLHGRITLTFHKEGDRERHFCFRILSHTNPIAFQTRLGAAMTASGIDRKLGFRHLFILRATDPPGGAKTARLVAGFKAAGGQFILPQADDLRAFVALREMSRRNLNGFDAWLRQRKPLCGTNLFKAVGLCPPPFEGPAKDKHSAAEARRDDVQNVVERMATTTSKQPAESLGHKQDGLIAIGRRFDRGIEGEPQFLKADLLPRHTAILAGSGSGKTVLLRRLVEEAALHKIPAIVLDTNNDLVRLGDSWPDRPQSWTEDDARKASEYQKSVEVVVFTPNISKGRPMSLALLPDFSALDDDADERNQAVEMARATLESYVGVAGTGGKLKQGVLADVLRRFAQDGGNGLDDFIALLSDLPDEVSQISKAEKFAADMADQLRAAIATNPLLQSQGQPLDPDALFSGSGRRTRISVINFSGLMSDEARQSFVNQLQMALFTWIKQHPSPTGRLYVLDEAQNFAPSSKATPCKESTLSLVAQARKYGLGMIFATQAPKGIDNKIISNCTTHFYGKMNSPATIDAVHELMAAKGGAADDVAKLNAGEFYFSSENVHRPIKLRTPLCLSWHPQNPLSSNEVIAKARG